MLNTRVIATPEGMDVVFDSIGGDNYKRSIQTLSEKGRLVSFGYTSILKGRPERLGERLGRFS